MADLPTGPRADPEASLAFLKRWSPAGPWVLTSIIPDGVTDTVTFRSEDAVRKWLNERQGKQNCYFHVNPVRHDLNVKASKEDIERLDWLHVDIDPRPGEDFDQERVRALRMLQEFKPRPTVITDSGGGYQGFWRLKESPKLIINGQVPRAQELEAYNIQLEKVFGADHCHNVDRIMRIPGTINVPTSRKLKKGRVPTLASLVEWDEAALYDITEFMPAVRVQNGNGGDKEQLLSGGQPRVRITGNVPVVGTEELRDWARDNNKTISDHTLAVIATGQDPLNPTKYKSRSEALFAVCCALIRAGVPEEMIFAVITGPNEIAASVREKRGWESYALRQIERAQEEAIDPWLRALNEKHAVIDDIGGKCRIISTFFDPERQRGTISKQSFEDFRNRYRNKRVVVGQDKEGNTIEKPVGTWWVDHPQRREYERIVFVPGKEVENCYNLWQGFSCDSLPGNRHERFLEHVKSNICSGNLDHYNYIVGWMARAVQEPNSPGEVAIVMRGKRGTGKSKFAKVFGHLFGAHFLQVSNSKHLVGSFNAHLRDTVVLFGDEAFFAGDRQHEGVLKTLITEESVVIEAKGLDAETASNYVHLIVASNEDWIVPAGLDERRFMVIEVGEGQKQNHEYFAKMDEDMAAGGFENLLHFLLSYDLSNYQVRKVPQTRALQEQKLLSMSPDQQWFFDKLWDGRMMSRDGQWDSKVLKDSLYNDYIRAMEQRRIPYRAGRNTLSRQLGRFCPPNKLVSKQELADVPTHDGYGAEFIQKKRAYVFYFPSLEVLREYWDKQFGGPYEWPTWEGMQETIPEEAEKPDPHKPPF